MDALALMPSGHMQMVVLRRFFFEIVGVQYWMFVVDAEVMDDVGETLADAGLETDEVLMAFEVEDVLVDAAREEEGREEEEEELLATLLLELIEELRLVLDDEVVATNEVVLEVATPAALFFVVTWEADFVALLAFVVAFTVALEVALVDFEPPAAGFDFLLLLPKIALRASRGWEVSSSTIVS